MEGFCLSWFSMRVLSLRELHPVLIFIPFLLSALGQEECLMTLSVAMVIKTSTKKKKKKASKWIGHESVEKTKCGLARDTNSNWTWNNACPLAALTSHHPLSNWPEKSSFSALEKWAQVLHSNSQLPRRGPQNRLTPASGDRLEAAH